MAHCSFPLPTCTLLWARPRRAVFPPAMRQLAVYNTPSTTYCLLNMVAILARFSLGKTRDAWETCGLSVRADECTRFLEFHVPSRHVSSSLASMFLCFRAQAVAFPEKRPINQSTAPVRKHTRSVPIVSARILQRSQGSLDPGVTKKRWTRVLASNMHLISA
ncbi:hypothetical protein LZ30DRAFT_386346 [Colletotrichum cereale]|nr:hypothetical protein LZ30DRAFT_386346 [Colletotrichum cereale]